MVATRKPKLFSRAAVLRAEGRSFRSIAQELGVASTTVARWFPKGETGHLLSVAERLCTQLDRRLEKLFADDEAAPDAERDPKLIDRALKLCKLREALRAGPDDVSTGLTAMSRFVRFCLVHMTEDEMPPIRRAVTLFIDELKRENS
jgi:AcrR family transcriptional regulator